jgi:hypothetical protein
MRLTVRRATSDPLAVAFENVEVDWPYVLVDRTPTGIFPLSLPTSAEDSSVERTHAAVDLRAARVLVSGGRIDFRDATFDPPYWRSAAELKLVAEDVGLPPARIARLSGRALVDELSPLHVEGTLGPRTRLLAELERLPLRPFNTYLAAILPYSVSSGVVSGRSEIVLDRSELDVDNRIVLSHLGLKGSGEDTIERELGVPLTLALALMKDYRGDIALDLPFGGDLGAPTFSMQSVMRQAILRAIQGAILSPLNALGRVVLEDGRIERFDLAPIPFPPGGRELDAAGRERAIQISRVLQTHPELRPRLRGMAAGADADRLVDEAVLSMLGSSRADEPLRAFLEARLAGSPPPPLDQTQAARLDALFATTSWPAEALQSLALDRGAAAAAALILEQGVAPGRVAVDSPQIRGPDDLAPEPGVSVELREP